MSDRTAKVNAVRAQVRTDASESVIGALVDGCGGDVDQAAQFLQGNIVDGQRSMDLESLKSALREVVPGLPDALYEQAIKDAHYDASAAVDALQQAIAETRKTIQNPRKPLPQPVVKPIVQPLPQPVVKPAVQPAVQPVVQPVVKPVAPKQQNDAELPVYSGSSHPEPSAAAAPAEPAPAPATKPKEEEQKQEEVAQPSPPRSPSPGNVAVANERAKDLACALMKAVAESKERAEEIQRRSEERARLLRRQEEELARLERQGAASAERVTEAKRAVEQTRAALHQSTVSLTVAQQQHQQLVSVIDEGAAGAAAATDASDSGLTESDVRSEVLQVVPEYQRGRLPTRECVITVAVDGKRIAFTWAIAAGVELSAKDWIGLYIHDRQYSNKYESYVSLGGAREGRGTFTAPTVGYYDLRYYRSNGSVERSRSAPFLVGPPMAVRARLDGRRRIAVSWDRSVETPGDWLALFAVGTYSNTQYLQSVPAAAANSDGVVVLDAPRRPGCYEVRYFFRAHGHASGYAFSGRSAGLVVPDEDLLRVEATHPVVRVRWQTFSQEPCKAAWVALYDSPARDARRLGWAYCAAKGLLDPVGDHGIAEIHVPALAALADGAPLPAGADTWEVRLFNKAPVPQPFLRAPFLNK